jgi:hypothetical protein
MLPRLHPETFLPFRITSSEITSSVHYFQRGLPALKITSPRDYFEKGLSGEVISLEVIFRGSNLQSR